MSVLIVGASLGGTFATYALFERPELFERYVIVSPGLNWDDAMLMDLEAEYAAKPKAWNKVVGKSKKLTKLGKKADASAIQVGEDVVITLRQNKKGVNVAREVKAAE